MKQKKYTNLSMFTDVIKTSPVLFIIEYLCSIFDGVLMGITTVQMEKVFTGVIGLANKNVAIKTVCFSIIMLLAIRIIDTMCITLSNGIGEIYFKMYVKKSMQRINQKCDEFNPIFFEDEKNLDIINKAINASYSSRQVMNVIMDLFCIYLSYSITLGIYLYKLKPSLILVLLCAFVPQVFSLIAKKTLHTDLEEKQAPIRRKKDMYGEYLSDYKYLKETRSLSADKYFKKLYTEARQMLYKLEVIVKYKEAKINIITKLSLLIGYACMFLLLIDAIKKGQINVGAFAAVIASAGELFSSMDEVFSDRLAEGAKEYPKMKNYIDFLNIEDTTFENKGANLDKLESISLKNISFTYPNSCKETLKNISVTINKNDTIGIVGENGSGKTTLSKIICGLYKQTNGNIYYNGRNTTEYNHDYILKKISGVFQNYCKYKMTLKDNVTISEINKKCEDLEIEQLLNSTGLDVIAKDNETQFIDLYDTVLAKEFGGTDLSGGQWQKVAIARGLYRTSDLIILDEPTASIDPLQEYTIYKLFEKVCEDKTAVIITHRLSSIRFCNRIIVMKDGTIIGDGDHNSLYNTCSYYKKLYDSQSMQYK